MNLDDHKYVKYTFSQTEMDLISQIRKLCDNKGKEVKPTETAKLFHQLGLLYMKKKDKRSLIRSAALLKAAIIRKPDNVDEIATDLKSLHQLILEESSAIERDADFSLISNEIRKSVDEMREYVKEELESVVSLPNDLDDDDEIQKLQEQKMQQVIHIQEEVSEKFTAIMDDVTKNCINILGKTPCKYALVGIGSLAKKEITPYSDFESVLVLEEGIQNSSKYESILEYFRWLAVISQVVVIGLGETKIRNVAVPGLNDLDSEDGDWFVDDCTPAGISCEGMLPYACKNPLGRLPTKTKPWETELIKPVKEMVDYLDSEIDIKDNYNLADILTRSCLVSGCKDLYSSYQVEVQNKLKFQRKNSAFFWEQLNKQIENDKKNVQPISNLSTVMRWFMGGEFDVKRALYRCTTIFVSAAGSYHGIDSASSIEVVDQLHVKGLLSAKELHALKCSIAFACEMRLRIYTKYGKQFDVVSSVDVKGVIVRAGIRSLFDYFMMINSLQKVDFQNHQLSLNVEQLELIPLTFQHVVSFTSGLEKETIPFLKSRLRKISGTIAKQISAEIDFTAQFAELDTLTILGKCLHDSKPFEEALAEFEACVRSTVYEDKLDSNAYAEQLKTKFNLLYFYCGMSTEMIELFELFNIEALINTIDVLKLPIQSQWKYIIFGKALFDLREKYMKKYQSLDNNPEQLTSASEKLVLRGIEQEKYFGVLRFLANRVLGMVLDGASSAEKYGMSATDIRYFSGVCFFNLSRYDGASYYFQKSLEDAFDFPAHKNCLYYLSRCFEKLGIEDEAKYYQKKYDDFEQYCQSEANMQQESTKSKYSLMALLKNIFKDLLTVVGQCSHVNSIDYESDESSSNGDDDNDGNLSRHVMTGNAIVQDFAKDLQNFNDVLAESFPAVFCLIKTAMPLIDSFNNQKLETLILSEIDDDSTPAQQMQVVKNYFIKSFPALFPLLENILALLASLPDSSSSSSYWEDVFESDKLKNIFTLLASLPDSSSSSSYWKDVFESDKLKNIFTLLASLTESSSSSSSSSSWEDEFESDELD
ncbi:unnamed protein product [Clavelina lepadiformis]|uniref:Protein-PII uridylyltransferase N-terminal domain-containing protein n=1 Tax=Clavelina lepadiformis TaxID=159417 RepID=A0ABP0F198_CLALP